MAVADSLAEVRERLAAAAARAGRADRPPLLVAVTKNQPDEALLEAARAGQLDFGENYLQKALPRMQIAGLEDVRWHLVGRLQSNKAKRAADAFYLLHGIDSASAGRALSRAVVARGETAAPCRVLMQIKLGGGQGRAGVEEARAEQLLRQLADMPGLSIEGVTGVADPGQEARPQFERLRLLRERLRGLELPRAAMVEISAGMSADYEDAIMEGSTMVRIGRAVFGQRERGES
ncbi:MAG: YggS family pyridoxal phosphate-dependent enzyme [Deltaproteobacteria bacterium]|nr:YggS family pyridoxal phosphate-dependent enzyme [Deltaproteobacteria bacterium]